MDEVTASAVSPLHAKSACHVSREPDALKGGDLHEWAVEQPILIRTSHYDKVDWVNVADERIISDFWNSPSLKSRPPQATDRGYHLARFVAARETGLPLDVFPKACPCAWDIVMERLSVLTQTAG